MYRPSGSATAQWGGQTEKEIEIEERVSKKGRETEPDRASGGQIDKERERVHLMESCKSRHIPFPYIQIVQVGAGQIWVIKLRATLAQRDPRESGIRSHAFNSVARSATKILVYIYIGG